MDEAMVIAYADLDQISDEWETLVSAGQQIVEAHDRNRWLLGDIALLKVQKRYGEDAIGRYADDVGVRPSTMYQYRDVSKMFEFSMRMEFRKRHPTLTWSHCYQLARLNALELALPLADIAEDRGWKTRRLKETVDEILGVDPPPEKVFDHHPVTLGPIDSITGMVTLCLAPAVVEGIADEVAEGKYANVELEFSLFRRKLGEKDGLLGISSTGRTDGELSQRHRAALSRLSDQRGSR